MNVKESKMTLGESLCSWRGIIILILDGPKKEIRPDISFFFFFLLLKKALFACMLSYTMWDVHFELKNMFSIRYVLVYDNDITLSLLF